MAHEFLRAAGVAIALIGVFIEVVGMAAVMFWPVRRRLPSPFDVVSVGGILFFVGIVILGLSGFVGPQ